MSISMAQVFSGDYLGFFLALGFVKFLQVLMLVSLYTRHPEARPKTYNLLGGFATAAFLWTAVAFVPDGYHFIVALSALAIEIVTPRTTGKGNKTSYLNVHHLQERLGLFLMLVVGESMIVVALANSDAGKVFDQLGVVFAGLGLMVALWWLYFEHSDEHAGVRPKNLFAFIHAHGFLFGSIILVSVGYKLVLGGKEEIAALTFSVLGMLGIAVTLIVIRSALHGVCLRATALVGGMLIVSSGVVFWGYWSGAVIETMAAGTILFGATAVIDKYGLFKKMRIAC